MSVVSVFLRSSCRPSSVLRDLRPRSPSDVRRNSLRKPAPPATDSPTLASRLVGQCFYSDAGASGGVTLISRIKVVRPPPAAPYGLAPCGICGQFPHLLTQTRKPPQTPQAKEDTYARKWVRSPDGITRPEGIAGAINLYRKCTSVVMPFYCSASYVYKRQTCALTVRLTSVATPSESQPRQPQTRRRSLQGW